MVRVRFAPSPTGNLHIGGSRTALFNWLYSEAKSGKFILRIEDTDKLRSEKKYLDEILDSLKWLGLKWDEIYFQSERFDIYRQYSDKLLKEGKAYTQKPESGTGEAVIFKVEPQKIKINDMIRGEIEFDSSLIKDQVLIKSDGAPTYNFACVVDDALMNITHVIRGDDHISNTPKQIMLYQALGFALPGFAHLPLILAKQGGRLSKRKGATAISEYRQMGYVSAALVNYLLLLGWSPGGNREVIDINEAIKLFDIKNINKTAAVLDLDKLDWMNNQYIKNEDPEKLALQAIPLLAEKGYINPQDFDRNYLISLLRLFQSRLTTVHDFIERADAFFVKDVIMDPQIQEKFLARDLSREFSLFARRLEKLENFDIANIETAFRELIQELGVESKSLIHPIRVALTGKTVGPGLFEVIYYLGKERTKERLGKFIKKEQA
ncbi:MAG: glutamate--tRNA ligase [Candidatus Omnitrophica bacterium]|nr:glutamate--tRNA ligase [Candidatus Omnitrophota bacterium]MBU1929018.1 glutamate--tRNA ligase [Candidatus Omnitrophota bacterium]MBU2035666.1 glutamate--tRNA ligase [Candidatus Omnitrophota bacterium]MBU2221101.1 glutamate--tRNA ligase [Candidatus Omnitrophota bacterium]MBU2258445.1 glutamate--tRNA ligase [Candidatus Omnitrophota bacterium]